MVLLGMISARTVNLTHVATERPGRALVASTCRRLQRFFQKVVLPQDWAVGLVITLIGHPPAWYLCLDRTSWKIGCQRRSKIRPCGGAKLGHSGVWAGSCHGRRPVSSAYQIAGG